MSLSLRLASRALAPLRRSAPQSARAFSAGGIPADSEHAVGRELAEVLDADHFNRDPLETEESQGNSKDDPILVPSFKHSRTVGVAHNDASYIFWFNLEQGKVHYLPQVEKYFKLYNPAELAQLVKDVEAKQE